MNIVLIPALLGLVGFMIYYKKNQKAAGPAKPEKSKPGRTKPAKVKAGKVKAGKKDDPVKPRGQRQLVNSGGRMGSVL